MRRPGDRRLAGQKVSRVAIELDGEVRVSVTLVVPSDSNGNGNKPYPAAAQNFRF